MVTTTSEKLTRFPAAHEGLVSRAYKCPTGVVTIDRGMTGRSKVFASYRTIKTGHARRIGDATGCAEVEAALTKMLAVEYSPPVAGIYASRSNLRCTVSKATLTRSTRSRLATGPSRNNRNKLRGPR